MAEELKVLSFPKATPKKPKKRRKYEMADGTFKAKPMINGKRYTIRGKSTKEVEEKIATLKAELQDGLAYEQRNITVEEWSALWFQSELYGTSERHQVGVQRQLDLINAQIGHMKVRDVRLLNLKTIINTRSGMSKSQIDKMHNTISRLFRSARQNRIISIDPALDLKKPEGTYTGHRCLEPWEIDLLLRNWNCCNAGVWAITMMLSGVRRGECFALVKEDFDFDSGYIHVHDASTVSHNQIIRTGKTKSQAGLRDTPMLEPLASIIKADFEQNPREDFVQSAHGGKITESSFVEQWKVLMRRLTNIAAGYRPEQIPPRNKARKAEYENQIEQHRVCFDRHDLRHTFATFLFEAGVDEKTAMFYLGHTSPEMTRDLYAHLREEQKRRSDASLKAYFKRFVQQPVEQD